MTKFEANRFFIFEFLLSGFHCIVCINAAVKPNAQSCQKEPQEKRIFRKKTSKKSRLRSFSSPLHFSFYGEIRACKPITTTWDFTVDWWIQTTLIT